MTKKEELFVRIEQLSEEQTKLMEELRESRLPELITFGAIDAAMKIRSMQFDKLMKQGRELLSLIKEVRLLLETK